MKIPYHAGERISRADFKDELQKLKRAIFKFKNSKFPKRHTPFKYQTDTFNLTIENDTDTGKFILVVWGTVKKKELARIKDFIEGWNESNPALDDN